MEDWPSSTCWAISVCRWLECQRCSRGSFLFVDSAMPNVPQAAPIAVLVRADVNAAFRRSCAGPDGDVVKCRVGV